MADGDTVRVMFGLGWGQVTVHEAADTADDDGGPACDVPRHIWEAYAAACDAREAARDAVIVAAGYDLGTAVDAVQDEIDIWLETLGENDDWQAEPDPPEVEAAKREAQAAFRRYLQAKCRHRGGAGG